MVDASLTEPNTAPVDSDETTYKCSACRITLFRESDIIEHNSSVKKHKARPDRQIVNQQCSSIFLEAADWMNLPYDGETQTGKISCPNQPRCDAKLGTFAHYGAQCSCGRWVNPSY